MNKGYIRKIYIIIIVNILRRLIMAMQKLLPLAAMEKLLKNAGADRVSEGAKIALKEMIEDIAEEISNHAIKLANHAGRKTVKAKDIKLAAK